MTTRKVAITMPIDLIELIDETGKKLGISRSKCISTLLKEKLQEEEEKKIKRAYDLVFSDDSVCEEQLNTASWFDNASHKGGQEW